MNPQLLEVAEVPCFAEAPELKVPETVPVEAPAEGGQSLEQSVHELLLVHRLGHEGCLWHLARLLELSGS